MAQEKFVAVIGATGVGKSSFCNMISGMSDDDPKAFPVFGGVESGTCTTTAKAVRWMGTGEKITLVDTPGLGDTHGRDTQHIDEMTDKLKHLQYVNAFIIMFNAANPRLDQNLQSQLKIFVKMFGLEFFDNAVMVFNRWGFDSKAEKKRKKTGDTQEKFTKDLNTKLRSLFGITRDIDAIVTDSNPDQDDEDEMKAVNLELSKMKQKIMKMPPFPCEDITAVRGTLDELQSKLKEEQEKRHTTEQKMTEEKEKGQKLEQKIKKEKDKRQTTEQELKEEKERQQKIDEEIKEQYKTTNKKIQDISDIIQQNQKAAEKNAELENATGDIKRTAAAFAFALPLAALHPNLAKVAPVAAALVQISPEVYSLFQKQMKKNENDEELDQKKTET